LIFFDHLISNCIFNFKNQVGKAKPTIQKVLHGAFMKTNIPAGLASAAPPLGTMLGQRGINIANFVKDFNQATANIKDGIPLPTRVQLQVKL
jgi:large subunit ribosomal protein L11